MKESTMKEKGELKKETAQPGNDMKSPDPDAAKSYETPELTKLGDVAELTEYDVSVIV